MKELGRTGSSYLLDPTLGDRKQAAFVRPKR